MPSRRGRLRACPQRAGSRGANDNPYSIDDNLWGRAIECGHLEDPWNEPLDDAWVMTKNPEDAPNTPTYTEIEFEAGKPVAVDARR